MKLVTAFVGSARRHGVTFQATRLLLDALEARGDVRNDVVFLSGHDVGLCRGCKACFVRGEAFCPLHDDRDLLLERLARSDGVVIATPVYSFQVSAHVKAFLDRLGFAFHRPRFHGKAFTSIAVEGLWGGAAVVRYLDLVGRGLGFNVVKGSRIVCRKNPDTPQQPIAADERRRMEETLARHARRFHARLLGPAFPRPTALQLFAFRTARTSIAIELPPERPDHAYYRDRGWLESDYWYPTRLGPLKRLAGVAFDRIAARSSRARAYSPEQPPAGPR